MDQTYFSDYLLVLTDTTRETLLLVIVISQELYCCCYFVFQSHSEFVLYGTLCFKM